MDFNDYANVIQQSVAQNNAWSAEQAQKQMDFQERMSGSAHQREVADLKAAGLNPVLSAHTNGASTPTGAMGDTDNSGTMALIDLMSQMIESQTAQSLAAIKASSGGSGYYNSALVQSKNYSTNPLLSFVQDVFEERTGKHAAAIANDFIDLGLDYVKNSDAPLASGIRWLLGVEKPKSDSYSDGHKTGTVSSTWRDIINPASSVKSAKDFSTKGHAFG